MKHFNFQIEQSKPVFLLTFVKNLPSSIWIFDHLAKLEIFSLVPLYFIHFLLHIHSQRMFFCLRTRLNWFEQKECTELLKKIENYCDGKRFHWIAEFVFFFFFFCRLEFNVRVFNCFCWNRNNSNNHRWQMQFL